MSLAPSPRRRQVRYQPARERPHRARHQSPTSANLVGGGKVLRLTFLIVKCWGVQPGAYLLQSEQVMAIVRRVIILYLSIDPPLSPPAGPQFGADLARTRSRPGPACLPC